MGNRGFLVRKDCYEEGINLYANDSFVFKPGVTILVGCNGAGKTTLMQHMRRALEDQNIPFLSFDNLRDGRDTARQSALEHGNIEFLAQAITSSEGEEIHLNIGRMASVIGRFARSKNVGNELWLFFDAIDSGLSIDNVQDVKDLFGIILEDNKDRDVYIIVSANAYEFASGEQCFDVRNAQYVSFENYDKYKEFILNSRKLKDSRHKVDE